MIEKIVLEINVPKADSVICDALLKFEIKASVDAISRFRELIATQIGQEEKIK